MGGGGVAPALTARKFGMTPRMRFGCCFEVETLAGTVCAEGWTGSPVFSVADGEFEDWFPPDAGGVVCWPKESTENRQGMATRATLRMTIFDTILPSFRAKDSVNIVPTQAARFCRVAPLYIHLQGTNSIFQDARRSGTHGNPDVSSILCGRLRNIHTVSGIANLVSPIIRRFTSALEIFDCCLQSLRH